MAWDEINRLFLPSGGDHDCHEIYLDLPADVECRSESDVFSLNKINSNR